MSHGAGRKRSVLLVCGSFNLGGTERNVLQIATGLDPGRFAVSVLAFVGSGPLRQPMEARGIPVADLQWSFDPRRLREDFERLRAHIAATGPDIVHVFNYPTIYFGIAAGVAAQVPARLVAVQGQDTWKGWLERIMDRLIRKGVTLYIADGDGARRFAIHHQGLDPRRIQLIYDGPDVDGLQASAAPAVLRQRLGLRADTPTVGVVARLQDAHKGQSVFLRSIAQLPARIPCQFVLVGGGQDEPALRQLARDLGVAERVVFAGPLPQLADVLHALDILVLPSLRFESVPKIILEGMATRRPVIASRVGDIPEVIEDGVTGLLVPPNDPRQLAGAMQRLLEHPEEARALGHHACAALEARKMTLQQSLMTLMETYESLAAARVEPPAPALTARMLRAVTVYRVLRLTQERVGWLLWERWAKRRRT
jgi:glycosyltransferase involved in cell wall biosynthesis